MLWKYRVVEPVLGLERPGVLLAILLRKWSEKMEKITLKIEK